MENSLKNVTISTLLCSVIILLNMDLSCLTPYLSKVASALETRKEITKYSELRYTAIIPDAYLLSVKKDVYDVMSKYVRSTLVDKMPVNNIITSKDVVCRGSPSNRSP
jgi:hypothetical protein